MKKFKFFSLLLILFVCLILAGCDSKGKVIAVVNGDNIYEYEFNNMVKGLYAVQSTKTTNEQKKQVYDSLITSKLVEQECKNLNIYLSDQEIKVYITNIAKINGLSESEFYKQLKKVYGYSEPFIKFLIKNHLEEEALYNNTTASVAALDEDGYKSLYNTEPGKYRKVQVSHILIKVNADSDDDTSKAKAFDLISQLNSGADFAALAKSNSDDSSASSGGVLSGYITSNSTAYVAEFIQGAMALNTVGDYTKKPIKTQYGYHIIKADYILDSYDELKDDIKISIDNANKKQAYEVYINNLKEKAKIDKKISFGN